MEFLAGVDGDTLPGESLIGECERSASPEQRKRMYVCHSLHSCILPPCSHVAFSGARVLCRKRAW